VQGDRRSILIFRDVTVKVRKEESWSSGRSWSPSGPSPAASPTTSTISSPRSSGTSPWRSQILDPDSKAVARLEAAERASDRAEELASKLLTFSKGGKPVRERISLESVVRESALLSVHGMPLRCEFGIAEDLWRRMPTPGRWPGDRQPGDQRGAGDARRRNRPDRGENVVIGQGEIAYVNPGPYVKIEVTDTASAYRGRT